MSKHEENEKRAAHALVLHEDGRVLAIAANDGRRNFILPAVVTTAVDDEQKELAQFVEEKTGYVVRILGEILGRNGPSIGDIRAHAVYFAEVVEGDLPEASEQDPDEVVANWVEWSELVHGDPMDWVWLVSFYSDVEHASKTTALVINHMVVKRHREKLQMMINDAEAAGMDPMYIKGLRDALVEWSHTSVWAYWHGYLGHGPK